MTSDENSTERSRNLWAPWRMEYIGALNETGDDCFLCRYRDRPAEDVEQLVLWRRGEVMVVMNRFPYTGGHLLIAPTAHVGRLHDLSEPTTAEMMRSLRDCQDVLTEVLGPDGFNVGINLGRCAGAGLPGHLHMHIVPRWNGDTNFMSVLGDVRVIPQALSELYDQLRQGAEKLGFLEG